MRKFLRENGLGLAVLGLFLVTMAGLAFSGFRADHQSRIEHHQELIGFGQYLRGAHFWEALSENWESEFRRWRRTCG
jgi:hypothetical protein